MSIFRRLFVLVLVLAICLAFPFNVSASEMDNSQYIVLDTFHIPLTAITYSNSRGKDVQVEIGADVQIQQLSGTNKIRTVIEVQAADFWSGVQIKSFSATIHYTNYTEFSIPDFQESLYKSTSSPTNFLIGTKDSGTSFVSGHTIGVTVTITDVQLANAQLAFTPGSYSTKVVIR